MLAGMIAPTEATWVALMVLYTACLQTSPKFSLHIWLAKLTVSRDTHPLLWLVLCPAG
jgi:hypothetical protein